MLGRIQKWLRPTAPIVHHLRLRGVIQDGRPGTLSLRNLEKALDKAFDKSNKRLAAVAVSINSPGGSPVQSELIANRMRALSQETNIPLYTFAEDVAASGGYWLLTAGDKCYCAGTSLVGSSGVVTGGFGFPSAIEKLGVERRVLTAGENKSRNDPFMPVKAEDVAKTTHILDSMHELFKAQVLERRADALAAEKHGQIFSGDVWLGGDAKTLGLVDGLESDVRGAMRREFGDDVEMKPIAPGPQIPWPFSSFQGAAAAADFGGVNGEACSLDFGSGERGGGMSVSVSADSILSAVEERAIWAPYQTTM